MAAGSIVVSLLMATGSFETDTKRAQASLKKFEKSVDEAAQKIKIGLAAAGAAMTALVYKTTQSAEEIQRFANLSGASAESFQEMAVAASTVGISLEKLADQFKDFRDKFGEFVQTGGGGMADFFEQIAPQIGVTAEQFRNLSGPQALQLYVSSLEKANLSQEQMSFYLESMASDTTALIPLLVNNGRVMQELGARARATGQIMSEDLIKNSIEFRRQMEQLTGALTGATNVMVQEFLPTLNNVAKAMSETQSNLNLATLAGQGFKIFIETVSILGANLAFVFQGIGRDIGGVMAMMNRLANFDLEGMNFIAESMRQDAARARAELDDLERRILGLPRAEVLGGQSDTGAQIPPGTPTPPRPASTLLNKKQLDAQKKAADDARKALIAGMDKDIDRITKQFEDLENKRLEKIKSVQDQAARIYEETRTPLEILNIEEARLNQLLQQGAIDWDTYGRAIMMVNEQYANATEKTQEFSRLAEDLGMSIATAFETAILTGKKLSDTLRDLAQDVLRLVMRQTVTEPLAAAISGSISAGLKNFGGAKATGGDVMGGGTYLVGENGPEMFTPRTTGTITPNSALGGPTVNQTINVTTGVQQTVRAEILSLMPQIANAAKSAVADAKLRGGSYAAALR